MPDYIEIPAADGTFRAYLARPDLAAAPVVVVLHEAFGINADMRKTCGELAAAGFIALCPDLYWRLAPGIELDPNTEEGWQKAQPLYAAFDRDKAVEDIAATVKVAQGLEGASGKVGILGFCMGGLMAFLTAARQQVDAAVAYHGAETEKYLGEAPGIVAPLLMHLAELDEFMPPAAQAAIRAALSGRPETEVQTYRGCYHAFARHNGLHYDAQAAAMANGRSIAFLARSLT